MQRDRLPLQARFGDIVASEDEIRQVIGEPSGRAAAKVIDAIDDNVRAFIARSPFVFIASVSESGLIDVSPKGDQPGFVQVLDETTLAIPDRPGNRRVDTFRNILRNPNVGIIFVIPGITYTVRVRGTAIIVRDAPLRETMRVNGKLPDHALVVDVQEVLAHCPKCMVRSGLWEQERWPDTTNLPTFAETLVAHSKVGETVEQVQAIVDAGNRERLY